MLDNKHPDNIVNILVQASFQLQDDFPQRCATVSFERETIVLNLTSIISLECLEMQNIETAIGNAEAILNSVTDAFYFLDMEWRFASINRRASELLDRQPQELLGETIWDEYPLLIGTDLEKTYRKVAAEKTNESGTVFYREHQRWYRFTDSTNESNR